MKEVWKFPIIVAGRQNLTIPKGALFLCVQMQREKPCLWALVDPSAPEEQRRVHTIGTGHPVNNGELDDYDYLGTYQVMDMFVWHVWVSR